MNLKLRLILINFFLLSAQSFAQNTIKNIHKAPSKPNLIVIMADDLGYADVGFNGCTDIPTPNIDRIANNGVKFTNGYTSYSVCGPSRAGFMTGRYGQRFGFERNPQYKTDDPEMGLPNHEKTIAEYAKTAGYTSGIIGKWHLGATISNHPLNRGFDEFFGHLGGGHNYFPENLVLKDSYFIGEEVMIPSEEDPQKMQKVSAEIASYRTWIMRNHDPVKTNKYLTDEFSDEAVHFIERHKEDPFFLFLSFNAPHSPLQATQKYLERFNHIDDPKRKTYAAMVSAVDDGVGQVLDKLTSLELDEKTIVVFLSDNGGPETKNGSDNGPLREGKGSIYEGGFRVPFAMQWKGAINKTTYDQPVSSLDILATLSELAGIPVDHDKPLDGVNLIPFVTGKKTGPPHSDIFIRKFDSKLYSIRNGNLKLIIKKKNNVKELYNLDKDISEEKNIAPQNPEDVKRMSDIIDSWESQLVDPVFLGLIHTKSWQKKKNRKKK